MDDYYKNRVDSPRKADGSYDFECLEAIDLELFNDHLQRLLAGEKVKMPKYNFRTGCVNIAVTSCSCRKIPC